MKYLKLFEEFKVEELKAIETPMSIEERDLKNLARRVKYNLRKFFELDKDTNFDIEVWSYAYKEKCITMLVQPSLGKEKPLHFKVFSNYINKMGIDHFISYDLTKQDAEQLLLSIKKDFKREYLELEAEKYNL